MFDKLLNPLRVIHLVIILFVTITAPAISYVKFQGTVREQFTASELKAERSYARKSDIDKINQKLDKVIEVLYELKGKK